MISIIIPTLNEEDFLPLLLESIKKQNFFPRTTTSWVRGRDYETIVADAGSKDRTLEIAKKYNCKITNGGLPAVGKNNGAKIVKGDLLLFLDADAVLPENFFEKSLKEFEQKELKIGTFCLLLGQKNKFLFLISNLFYNWPIIILENLLPHAATGILIKKELFEKLNGFDESIKITEDHDLARRAQKIGKYGILKSTKIFVSDRRFKKDGWIRTAFKYFLCELHLIFLGPIRSDIFKYRFGRYKK